MNKITNSIVLGSALAAATLISGPTLAAGLSGNVGIVSDYFFRGIDQAVSSTASGGIDYDFGNGLSIGTWGADVGDGLEVDLYGSYAGEASGVSYSIGFTTYNYTGDTFDDTYQEVNLGLGMGPVSLDFASGKHDLVGGGDEDYTYIGLTFTQDNAYVTYGVLDSDLDEASALYGSYIELGYGMESGGFDVGVALIRSDKDLSGITDSDGKDAADINLAFSLGKSFDL